MRRLNNQLGVQKLSLLNFDHLGNGIIEAMTSISKALVNTQAAIILHGCVVTKLSNNYTWTAGAILYQGEVYQVAGSTITLNSTTSPKWKIKKTFATNEPVPHLVGGAFYIHEIWTITLVNGAEVSGPALGEDIVSIYNQTRKIESILRNKITPIGQIEMLAVVPSDFDGTGLGNIYTSWEGWAIMNGNNGTIDMRKFFPAGYDSGNTAYNAAGKTGGVDSVTLTAAQSGLQQHTHSAASANGGKHTPVAQNGGSHSHTIQNGGSHSHDITDAGHDHNVQGIEGADDNNHNAAAAGFAAADRSFNIYQRATSSKSTGISINNGGSHNHTADNSGVHAHTMNEVADHTHDITVNNVNAANASQSHENRPPFKVILFLQKIA